MRKTNKIMFTKYWANFLSKALKQAKAGPRSLGTPFLVSSKFVDSVHAIFSKRLIKLLLLYIGPYMRTASPNHLCFCM